MNRGSQAHFYQDCCCWVQLIKTQLLDITFQLPSFLNTSQQRITFPSKDQTSSSKKGRLYNNTYRSCSCCSCGSFCCGQKYYQVQMEDQKLTETTVESCTCCYPHTVRNRHQTILGYVTQPCCNNWGCCAQINVHDQNNNHIYNVTRRCCTCCETVWDITNLNGQNKGQIISSSCCYSLCKNICCCSIGVPQVWVNLQQSARQLLLWSILPVLP